MKRDLEVLCAIAGAYAVLYAGLAVLVMHFVFDTEIGRVLFCYYIGG